MSTLTLKLAFPMHSASGKRREFREQNIREAMQPARERTIALTAGAIAVALFSVLAPMAGDPTERLYALDATPTIPTDETIAMERPFELWPTMLGPAITSESLMLAEALHIPLLEVRATPVDDEVVYPPQG